MSDKRKIAVVTGTRADYGLLYWIIKGISDDPELELQLLVTGMHLSPEFGLTYRNIEQDSFPIAQKVEMLLSSDTNTGMGVSIGLGVIGFSQALERLAPDIIVLLGDRFEILAAAVAAMAHKIPIAHIHGGESTQGAIDESIRHAITKMSHLHFPAADTYAERIKQMGEEKERIFTYGAPGLDNIYKLKLLSRQELTRRLDLAQPAMRTPLTPPSPTGGEGAKENNLSAEDKLMLVTYHPATLEKTDPCIQTNELLSALERILHKQEVKIIFTFPNADAGGRGIIKLIKRFADNYPQQVRLFINLGSLMYLSLMKYADVMAGNSSSGIIEAPSFKLPVVNIGDRQLGRVKAVNIIDTVCKTENIYKAVIKALSPEFKNSLYDMTNPYGQGNTSIKIVETLKQVKLGEQLIKKKFITNQTHSQTTK